MRIAVVSPFLDRRHGTERVILEQVQRFAQNPGTEIHIYAQRLQDLQGVSRFRRPHKNEPGRIFWHLVPALPGPHLFGYLWWFFANHFWRWWDAHVHGLTYDLVYSPGINAVDADVIAVHIVFHAFHRGKRAHLKFADGNIASWPRLVHRRLYYRLIMALESRVYPRKEIGLVAVARLVSDQLQEWFNRSDARVVPNAVDADRFTPGTRSRLRETERKALDLSSDTFALLMIGNDWANKGLHTLLQCLDACGDLPITLLVVGKDDGGIFAPLVERLGLRSRVQFHGPTNEIERFFAAADVYAGPSLGDSFALPPLEAMACGLPVITSVNNGGSQVITEGVDGFVLADPCDVAALSQLVRRLYEQPEYRTRVGENAARTAQLYTWDRNAAEIWKFLQDVHARKARAHLD